MSWRDWRDWTGLGPRSWEVPKGTGVQPSKSLWDLLQLLIVPAILIGITLAWNASQNSRESRRADQDRQDTTLNDYIQQMRDLILAWHLPASKPSDPLRPVARTITLTALHRLDGERKGEVVRFLHETKLIVPPGESNDAKVDLISADMTSAVLEHVDLSHDSLYGANLRHAELRHAVLSGTDLTTAHLEHADLREADLSYARLDAYLSHADLRHADLEYADLAGADLAGADLRNADLRNADLAGATLDGAKLEGALGLPKRTL
jgi:pentapeptide repeat protein